MKRKMKITISALAVMFVAAIAVAIASFSFAGNGDKDDLLEDSQILADASGSVSEKTIIDYIIENSYSVDPQIDPVYHIVEVTSSGDASSFSTYANSGAFKNYVVDGNKTIEQLMAEGKVDFQTVKATLNDSDGDEFTNALDYIAKADLIYVSNDVKKKYAVENDISEKMFDALNKYAITDFKPLIIDNPNVSTDTADSKTMKQLASDAFGPNEKYYYTFQWKDGVTAEQYLGHSNSLYLGINGETQKSKVWSTVYTEEPVYDGDTLTSKPFTLARVLTISENGTTSRTDQLLQKADNKNPVYTGDLYQITDNNGVSGSAIYQKPASATIYSLSTDSIMYINGYNNRVQTRPNYIENDVVTLSDAAKLDFDQYDMIILEDSCYGETITKDVYKKFAAAMYGKIHIVYGSNMGTGTEASTDNVDDATKRESNYMKLLMLVGTTDFTAKYDNIMITTHSDFDIIVTSESVETGKVIADLINKSKYRGIGGNSSSSSMFTVLELQPCYPIDLDLAVTLRDKKGWSSRFSEYKGTYYTDPSNMLDNKSKEEVKDGQEYYAWELTKAKISDALGIPYDKINLVHMSTEEFAGDKTEILGTYDLIYIGGNTSALKDAKNYMELQNQYIGQEWGNGHYFPALNKNLSLAECLKQLPIYTMYSHNGDLVNVSAARNATMEGQKAVAQVIKDGNYQNTFTYLNGNDITYNRYCDLKDYIEKGMPVVVSKAASDAYRAVKDFGYSQNSLDPDCNMFKVLDACQNQMDASIAENNASTVVTGFDQSDVTDIVSDGTLGDTLTGYVSVFNQNSKSQLLQLYNNANKKPKLVVRSMPTEYNRFDKSSFLTEKTLNFKYDVIGTTNYTATLYVDDNGNSKFDRSESSKERMATSKTNTLSYECAPSFFGSVYWMLEIVDNDTGLSVSQTGFSYIRNSEDKKQQVSILQIMPPDPNGKNGGPGGLDALYFCPICQRSKEILEYNPKYLGGEATRFSDVIEYNGYYTDSKDVNGYLSKDAYIGRHKHDFGVAFYDSQRTLGQYTGSDEYYVNLADEVEEYYDFDIDIIRADELAEWSDEVRNAFEYKFDGSNFSSERVTARDVRSKLLEALTTPSESSSKYEDYHDILVEQYLKVLLAAHEGTALDNDKNIIIAKLKEENPKTDNQTDAEYNTAIEKKYSSMSLNQKLTILEPSLTQELKNVIEAFDYNASDDAARTEFVNTYNALYISQMMCEFADVANEYKLKDDEQKKLVEENKKEVEALLDTIIANYGSKGSVLGNAVSLKEIQDIKSSGYYFDMYALTGHKALYDDITSLTDGKDIKKIISDYYHALDTEIEYSDEYKRYTRFANGTNWMAACYSTVLLGPSDSFGKQDITSEHALDDLETYTVAGHQIVLFHDTLSPYQDAGAVQLTARLRSYFGMDRYHMQTATEAASTEKKKTSNPVIGSNDSSYVKYVLKNDVATGESYSSEKYFMTNLSNKPRDDESRYGTWGSDSGLGAYNYYLTDVAYTDNFNVGDESSKMNYAIPYRYVQLKGSDQSVHMSDAKFDMAQFYGKYGTNKASQNNAGLVTTFPFTIPSEINIGPTHGQAFALDLEDDDMTVWYSLAGGDSGPTTSSIYAASPRDAMDSYYLYSYRNVFYCGAGHTNITGIHKMNNNERYLFINIMCNSVRLSIAQPKIYVYDYDSTETKEKNDIIKKDGSSGYVMKIADGENYPEFNFKVLADSSKDVKLTNVKIFYDLDYSDTNTDNAYVNNKKHILIADWGSDQVVKGQNKHVFRFDASLCKLAGADNKQIKEIYVDENGVERETAATTLKLLPEYFEPYNGEYTYIVIEATDSEGQKVYQRIKIKTKTHLFDLT